MKTKTSWSDIKTVLADFDRAALLGLLQNLYASNKENQAFLHARLNVGDDVLKPYKASIERWLSPDVYKNQDVSVAKAKKAISDYRKALGPSKGLAELMVFYCEQASEFSSNVGMQDEAYADALVRMFEQALKTVTRLPTSQCEPLCDRLAEVRDTSRNFGYGVSDDMNGLLAKYEVDD